MYDIKCTVTVLHQYFLQPLFRGAELQPCVSLWVRVGRRGWKIQILFSIFNEKSLYIQWKFQQHEKVFFFASCGFGQNSDTVERATLRSSFFKHKKKENRRNVFHIRHDSCALWNTSAIMSLLFSVVPAATLIHMHTRRHSKSLSSTITSSVNVPSSSAAKIWCIRLQRTGTGTASEQ